MKTMLWYCLNQYKWREPARDSDRDMYGHCVKLNSLRLQQLLPLLAVAAHPDHDSVVMVVNESPFLSADRVNLSNVCEGYCFDVTWFRKLPQLHWQE